MWYAHCTMACSGRSADLHTFYNISFIKTLWLFVLIPAWCLHGRRHLLIKIHAAIAVIALKFAGLQSPKDVCVQGGTFDHDKIF